MEIGRWQAAAISVARWWYPPHGSTFRYYSFKEWTSRAAPRPVLASWSGRAHRGHASAVVPVILVLAVPAERSHAPRVGAPPLGSADGQREGNQGRALARWRIGNGPDHHLRHVAPGRRAAPGFSMNTQEKLEMGGSFARLNVDVIEAGFPISSDGISSGARKWAKQVGTLGGGPIIWRAQPVGLGDIDRPGGGQVREALPHPHLRGTFGHPSSSTSSGRAGPRS